MSDTSHIGLIHTTVLVKDAIHIAIAQVSAGEELKAGDRVGFKDKEGIVFKDATHIGLVDPFIQTSIKKDNLFYLFLYPNSVTSLTHQWEHPSFDRSPEKIAAADKWLKKHTQAYFSSEEDDAFAEWEGTNYHRFIEEFKAGDVGTYAYGDDFSEHYNNNIDGFKKKFWDNLEIVTGIAATKTQRDQEYFSCSC